MAAGAVQAVVGEMGEKWSIPRRWWWIHYERTVVVVRTVLSTAAAGEGHLIICLRAVDLFLVVSIIRGFQRWWQQSIPARTDG